MSLTDLTGVVNVDGNDTTTTAQPDLSLTCEYRALGVGGWSSTQGFRDLGRVPCSHWGVSVSE